MNPATAVGIALVAHRGQTEKNGKPYMNHLYRVALAAPVRLVACAYLHDVVEDSDVTLVDLHNWGLTIHECTIIDTVTRKPEQITYPDFITDIIDSRIADAIELKLLDVDDHLRPGCENVLTLKQIAKYQSAQVRLKEAL